MLSFQRTFLTLLHETAVGCTPSLPPYLLYFSSVLDISLYSFPHFPECKSHEDRLLFCSMPVSQMPRKQTHTKHGSSLSSLDTAHHPPIVHYTSIPHDKASKGERLWRAWNVMHRVFYVEVIKTFNLSTKRPYKNSPLEKLLCPEGGKRRCEYKDTGTLPR